MLAQIFVSLLFVSQAQAMEPMPILRQARLHGTIQKYVAAEQGGSYEKICDIDVQLPFADARKGGIAPQFDEPTCAATADGQPVRLSLFATYDLSDAYAEFPRAKKAVLILSVFDKNDETIALGSAAVGSTDLSVKNFLTSVDVKIQAKDGKNRETFLAYLQLEDPRS